MGVQQVAIIAALIFVNGFFVAAEFALVKVRAGQIEALAARGHWAARLTKRALGRLDAYLSASQIGITVASLALGKAIETSVEPAIHQLLRNVGLRDTRDLGGLRISVVFLIALSVVTLLHMALGEQAPKTLAIRSARRVALITAPVLVGFYFVFWPIIWLLNASSNLTLRLLGMGSPMHTEVAHSEEELRRIVAESVAGGHLTRRERTMIENVLNLEAKTARRVMVPRTDIVYLSLARPLDDGLRVARQAGHTRFPLCEDDLTTVVGMIHIKDLFRVAGAGVGRPDLRKIARTVPFLPESMHLDRLLAEFQKNRVHLAMLVDEFGSVVGMVSLENVLEELVGPIQDEFDRESPPITPLGDGAFEVDAACPLDVLAEETGIRPPETEAETVGGLVVDILGRLAQVGDSVEVGDHRMLITKAEPNRVRRLRVEPIHGAGHAP